MRYKFVQPALAMAMITVAATIIVLRFLNHPNGYLSSDSTNYLGLSFSILSGNWLWLPKVTEIGILREYMAIWPPAYPIFISFISKFTSLDLFFSSKLVSLLSYVAAALSIILYFRKERWALVLLLTGASTIHIFTFSWSEGPFILVMILLSINMSLAIQRPGVSVLTHFLYPILLSVLLFELRYIGIFSIIVILVFSVLAYHAKARKQAGSLAASAILSAVIMWIHLSINYELTGYLTGQQRFPAPESNLELLQGLQAALLKEFLLPITSIYQGTAYWIGVAVQIILCLGITIYIFLGRDRLRSEFVPSMKPYAGFFITGILYLFAIIFLRWRSHFDDFGFRLLNPGILLIYLSLLGYLLASFPRSLNLVFFGLVSMSIFSCAWLSREVYWSMDQVGYNEATEGRLQRYADIPSGSVLVFGDEHLRYLRPDIHIVTPEFVPYWPENETWEAFRSRLPKSTPVYIDSRDDILFLSFFDPSVLEVMASVPQGEVSRLEE